jgi:sigma-E factor negative regulatory protein RseB
VKWLVALLLLAAGPLSAREEAQQWLEDMSTALRTLDYDGTFVYLHDGKLEAMRIIHQADGGVEKERLVSLTGSAREVLRDNKAVTCIMPDSKSVMVGQSRQPQRFHEVPSDLDSLRAHYHLEVLGDDRVAGQMARVVAITPRDAYRYGYRFWIGKQSKMMLKSALIGVDGEAIEQVMFTRLGLGRQVAEADLEPSLSGQEYSWYRQSGDKPPAAAGTGMPAWKVQHMPGGFHMTNYQQRRMRPDSAGAEHLVFSDGLATVSVYVETVAGDSKPFAGLSSMGAVNAYGAVADGHQITVVGEVPAATVEMMARSTLRADGAGR